MVESPQRIWIEADDECPYFYEAHELHDVEQDVIEYVRADLYAALEAKLADLAAENERLKEALEMIARIDLSHLSECREIARAALAQGADDGRS